VDRQEAEGQNLAGVLPLVGKERTGKLRFICSDMWRPYLKVIAKKAAHAVHILDRFHIMAHLSKAIDEFSKPAIEFKWA